MLQSDNPYFCFSPQYLCKNWANMQQDQYLVLRQFIIFFNVKGEEIILF